MSKLQTFQRKYSDCIMIGFIAGLGVTLIVMSYLFIQHAQGVQKEVFSIRAQNQSKVLKLAQETCDSGVVGDIYYQDMNDGTWVFKLSCGESK